MNLLSQIPAAIIEPISVEIQHCFPLLEKHRAVNILWSTSIFKDPRYDQNISNTIFSIGRIGEYGSSPHSQDLAVWERLQIVHLYGYPLILV